MAKFCKNCGSPVGLDERFCPQCGTALTGTPAPNPEPAPRPEPVRDDAYAEEKAQGVDWKQFKPKLEIGKPQITFISSQNVRPSPCTVRTFMNGHVADFKITK